jgi:hypothetical protein
MILYTRRENGGDTGRDGIQPNGSAAIPSSDNLTGFRDFQNNVIDHGIWNSKMVEI